MARDPKRNLTDLSQALLAGKRDSLGFIEGDQPNLTAEQISWLTYRMGASGDSEATRLSELPQELVESWGQDEGFLAVYGVCLTNKREAFKLIGTQLLPNAIRAVMMLFERAEHGGKDSVRSANIALNILLRTQGMMIDRVNSADSHKVEELLGLLREPQPLQVLEMEPRP